MSSFMVWWFPYFIVLFHFSCQSKHVSGGLKKPALPPFLSTFVIELDLLIRIFGIFIAFIESLAKLGYRSNIDGVRRPAFKLGIFYV